MLVFEGQPIEKSGQLFVFLFVQRLDLTLIAAGRNYEWFILVQGDYGYKFSANTIILFTHYDECVYAKKAQR